MSQGALMLDLEEVTLTKEEHYLLEAPEVGGVILFSRNYQNVEQLTLLIKKIRSVREDILIGTDHEGGRVQRFKHSGFTPLPSAYQLNQLVQEQQKALACHAAHECGWLAGVELAACDIDINFAPVLDINRNISTLLKLRCFGNDVNTVIQLASSYLAGLCSTGVHAVAKHFPGHGGVRGDTHISLPQDPRAFDVLQKEDLAPFAEVIRAHIKGIMPSHVVYHQVDEQPAGFSKYWLYEVLRQQLGFNGLVFSDCLSMGRRFCGRCG